MPCWNYDRRDRLAALADRCRAAEHALYRERCDLPPGDHAGRAGIDRRRAMLDARCRRIQAAYRAEGHAARRVGAT